MATLTQDVKQLVQEKAKAIRVSIVQSVTAAKSGHPGGSLSIADVMALLYYVEMNVDPAKLLIEIVLSFLKVMQRLHYTLHWLKKVISLKKNS